MPLSLSSSDSSDATVSYTHLMYLEQRAEEDALFAKKYRNPAKNMDECVTHILTYVQTVSYTHLFIFQCSFEYIIQSVRTCNECVVAKRNHVNTDTVLQIYIPLVFGNTCDYLA